MNPQKLQRWAGKIAAFAIVPLYFIFLKYIQRYRVRDIDRLRLQWRDMLQDHPGPWVICANHLTMIDSLILTYGLLSGHDHLRRYDRVPWNLPERANFQRHFILTFLCYLAKCIPISRGGDRDEMKKTLETCHELLAENNFLLIFPEGGRSRTGRINIENYSYGVGRFVVDNPDCRVLCVYLRGDRQETYSNFPPRGDCFTMMLKAFIPERIEVQGLRAQRHYAGQIIQQLSRMEEEYFATHRQRHHRSEYAREPEEDRKSAVSQSRLHA